jgi:protein-S-isoprenylcysteine O-methyltransferase Ste14
MRKRPLTYALLGPLPQAIGYVAGPIVLARGGRRKGWRGDRPGPLNLVGAAPLTAGAAFIGAAIVAHYHDSPEEMASSLVPNYLVRSGVYGVTRNPMYVGGSLMLAGWAVVFGSARLAAVCGVYLCGMNFGGIPFEERLLHRKFGATYDAYRQHVPRWL